MTNRLLLAIVVGLAALSSLFSLLTVSRENTNASATDSLKVSAARMQEDSERQIAELKTSLERTNENLKNAIKSVGDVGQQLAKAERDLGKVRKDLEQAEQTLRAYRALDWLNERPFAKAPWTPEMQKLALELEQLKKKLPAPPKP